MDQLMTYGDPLRCLSVVDRLVVVCGAEDTEETELYTGHGKKTKIAKVEVE